MPAKTVEPLAVSFTLIAAFTFVELVVGLATGSLALTADAGHMATDTLGVGMALGAAVLASRTSPEGARTFGLHRLEIVAALVNALLLLGVAIYVVVEAVSRLATPTDIDPIPMVVVGGIGLVINAVTYRILREPSRTSLNVEGALLEIVGDLFASVGVVAAGVVILVTGWQGIDALMGFAIAGFILPRALALARKAMRILTEAAPEDVDVRALGADLGSMPHVVGVHDVHVWTVTSGMHAASAHIVVTAGSDTHATLDRAREVLAQRYGIDHGTFQIEPESHIGCDELSW